MRVKDMTSGISIIFALITNSVRVFLLKMAEVIQNEYKQRRRQEYIPRVKKHL